jgi:predicted RNA-binding Zn-ribbon protein involved in translation (DUF1610 family)
MFFCAVCKNMLDPLTTKGELLEFKCKRCGNVLINFRNRLDQKCMLYSKSLAAGKTFLLCRFQKGRSRPQDDFRHVNAQDGN